MIHPELLTHIRLLADAYRPPVAAGDQVREVTAVTALTAVQQVLAEVEARLSDGRFRVFAAGQRFDVDLPAGTRAGDRVLIALPDAAASASLARSNPAGEAAQARVSEAGRFISQLMQEQAPASSRSPTSIAAAQPLLPDAPLDVAKTAATLRELIGLSGLFYESHQAEWVSGKRDTAQLLREPQGRNPPLAAQPARADSPAPPGGNAVSALATEAAAVARAGVPGEARTVLMHPDAAPIVQQQMNALETNHIVWNGQIWPGQSMRWELEPAESEAQKRDAAGRAWQTRISLDLPHLGSVTAILDLEPAGLRVRLSAQATHTDALIDAQLADLRSALSAAGLPLVSVMKMPHVDA